MDKLRISDNGRYFVKPDGTPFIWLADTAWTVPARLAWDDVQHYMKTRKEQGFTVLQMVVLDPEFNADMRNPCGIKALWNDDLLKPEEAYFSYVDRVLDQAEAYGFYVLLLPVWGELVVGWDWSGGTHKKLVTEKNAFAYGKWLGSRLRHRSNILWCLGGDRMPVTRGEDFRPVWREMAEGLSDGLTGKRLKYNADREEWKKLLMTYHACHEAETGKCSTFSYWTTEDMWISFTMLQSGHGLYKKNYELVEEERKPKPFGDMELIYPVWDGEPAYEMMPTSWPVTDENSFHGTYMVRKRAYWALFAGAFGHTYGHASVWCTAKEQDKNIVCRHTWAEAIQSEGSKQMKILRDFMEAYPLNEFVPCRERLLRQAAEEDLLDLHEEALASKEKKQMLVYFAADTEECIDVTGVFTEGTETGTGDPDGDEGPVQESQQPFAAWFDPADGSLTEAFAVRISESEDGKKIISVRNDSQRGEDRVLILAENPEDIAVPSGIYQEKQAEGEIAKVFEW